MVNLSLRKKPKIENPKIQAIKVNFKNLYEGIRVGYGGTRFLSAIDFIRFAKDHEVEDLFVMPYHTYTEFCFHYNGLIYEIELTNMVDV